MPAVDPDGFPGIVAANELVESAWGNATVNKLRENRSLILNLQSADGTTNGRLANHDAQIATINANIDRLFSRDQWLRESLNDGLVMGGAGVYHGNENGDFTINLPYAIGVSSATAVVNVNDVNVGAWAVVNSVSNLAITGRLFTGFGGGTVPVKNIDVGMTWVLFGLRSTPMP